MPTAASVLLSITSAPSGSTTATHLNSASTRVHRLGGNLSGNIEVLEGNLLTGSLSGNVSVLEGSIGPNTLSANIQTLSGELSCG